MKGTIIYSSLTGNTQKLAEELFTRIKQTGDWKLYSTTDKDIEIQDAEVVLFGGWAENGTLNKTAQKRLSELNIGNKKLGLFMTMGARTHTQHGHMCVENLKGILENYNGIGVQVMQGYISPKLMQQLSELPESAVPQSVKDAMLDGVESYNEPTEEEYAVIADYFVSQF